YMLETTFIMVTHDQEEAMSMADKMAVMKNGRVLQIGTAEEIYETTNSRFVAEFVDSINIFRGLVIKTKNKKGYIGIKIDESPDMIFAISNEDVELGSIVWLGLRPEEISIHMKPAPKSENQLEGK